MRSAASPCLRSRRSSWLAPVLGGVASGLDTDSAESLHRHLIAQVQHLEAGEAVVVQVLARPAPGKLYGRLLAHAGRAEAEAYRLRSHKAPGATRAMAQVRKAWPRLDDALWLTRVREGA